ncbi:MAG: Peptidase [Pedosphaera sp.]|nr:Peptidase [Pedosphaera sp.]
MRLVNSSQLPAGVRSEGIQAGLGSVSEARLREWVEKISIPRHSQAQPENNRATARWLSEQFTAWGYEVQLQGAYNNVVAMPRGRSGDMILVGAHYDSVPETPGADDNGSAVAAMLGCAEVFSRIVPGTPVCFVAFNCEEEDLAGSIDFVRNHLPKAGSRIIQAHILEMVGFASYASGSQRVPTGLPLSIRDTGDFLGLLANKASGGMMDSILAQASTYLPEFRVVGLEVVLGAERLFPVLARSDHVPFWEQGIPAVMWTDTSEFRNHNYHKATDTPETLDYGFLLMVTQLLVACVGSEGGLAADGTQIKH